MTTRLAAVIVAVMGTLAWGAFPVEVSVDVAERRGELKPIWRFFGADEPNYAYMEDGRALLGDLGRLRPGKVYFRTHNLLTTGDGTPALKWGSTNAYTEDAEGRPVYDWTIVDRIFDAYRANGVRPYVQLGFMPKALSVKPEPYQHAWHPGAKYEEIYTGWAYPPRDWGKWEQLIEAWVAHCVGRYGEEEVLKWYWQTWNEANIPYWRGTKEEFFRLHDVSVRAVRRVLPGARVGGPDSAGGGTKWFREFLEHCREAGTPTDFVSFHAKGAPKFVDGHVRMGIANQLRDIDGAFGIVASMPEFKGKPIVIGESDPDGCAACQGPQLGYRNGTMYSSYTAATFPRILDLAEKHGVNVEGALTWAFEFEDQPAFTGFRVLATRGNVPLPVLNVFRLMARMGGGRVGVVSSGEVGMEEMLTDGVRGKADVAGMACVEGGRVSVLLWHYHDDDVPGEGAEVALSVKGVEGERVRVVEYRVDGGHGNAFAEWRRMGEPRIPSEEQTRQLKKAGEVRGSGERIVEVREGRVELEVGVERQGVVLVVVERE